MNKIQGVFLSDVHLPDSIDLSPVFEYLQDYKPDLVILGGDIIDAKGMHGVEQTSPSETVAKLWQSYYERDTKLLADFIQKVMKAVSKKTKIIFLEGNHEQRYRRIMERYPELFKGKYDFHRDVVKPLSPTSKWIPYGDYESFYQVGDCLFMHGTMYPENHAKQYVLKYLPSKVVYGHLHHYQAFTYHSGNPKLAPRYALTGGCLSHLTPEWKRGAPHMWQNGFVDFISDKGITTPTVHLIERGRFYVGGKEYK